MSKKIIIVSGLSGAGKTTVLSIFTDLGYRCLDNFPFQLMQQLYQLMLDDSYIKEEYIVLGINILELKNYPLDDLPIKLILLTAQDKEILLRYKNNRRIHPLVQTQQIPSMQEAIALEKEAFSLMRQKLQNHALVIDTSFLTKRDLMTQLKAWLPQLAHKQPVIQFMSFGYRFGLPIDADYLFDVRFLDNPYWQESLRHKIGLDEEVKSFVIDKVETQHFLEKVVSLLDFIFSQNSHSDRFVITIAIGCTGGQHRSVAISQWLYEHYKEQYNCMISHRDSARNLSLIQKR